MRSFDGTRSRCWLAMLSSLTLLAACAPFSPEPARTTLAAERTALLRQIDALPRPRALALLQATLTRAPRPQRRAAAARILGLSYLLSKEELRALARGLDDAEPEVRRQAALALLAQLPSLERAAKLVASTKVGARDARPAFGGVIADRGRSAQIVVRPSPSSLAAGPATEAIRAANERTRAAIDELRRVLDRRAREPAAAPFGGPSDVLRLLDQSHLGTPFPMPHGSSIAPYGSGGP